MTTVITLFALGLEAIFFVLIIWMLVCIPFYILKDRLENGIEK